MVFGAKEGTYLHQVLTGMGLRVAEPFDLWCDNAAAVSVSRNPVAQDRSKHVRVWYHYTRVEQEKGTLRVSHVGTKDQLADIMTKALPLHQFQRLRWRLGVRGPPEKEGAAARSVLGAMATPSAAASETREAGNRGASDGIARYAALDSGCTVSVTRTADCVRGYRRLLSGEVRIRVGNGAYVDAIGAGRAVVTGDDGAEVDVGRIYHAPGMKFDLLSVMEATKTGHDVIFRAGGKRCEVIDALTGRRVSTVHADASTRLYMAQMRDGRRVTEAYGDLR